MEITVYRVPDGRYVLIPKLFQPSMTCRQLFETLVECGHVNFSDALRSDLWSRVIDAIERDTYAVLGAHAAADLLGSGHRCLGDQVKRMPALDVSSMALPKANATRSLDEVGS